MKYLCFSLLLCLSGMAGWSQSAFTIEMMTQASKNPVNNFDTVYTYLCYIKLSDTSDVDEIHVKMGTNQGSGDLVDHHFVFDKMHGLPSGTTYHRNSDTVRIGLGNRHRRNYYLEIRTKDSLGNYSSTTYWNNL